MDVILHPERRKPHSYGGTGQRQGLQHNKNDLIIIQGKINKTYRHVGHVGADHLPLEGKRGIMFGDDINIPVKVLPVCHGDSNDYISHNPAAPYWQTEIAAKIPENKKHR